PIAAAGNGDHIAVAFAMLVERLAQRQEMNVMLPCSTVRGPQPRPQLDLANDLAFCSDKLAQYRERRQAAGATRGRAAIRASGSGRKRPKCISSPFIGFGRTRAEF